MYIRVLTRMQFDSPTQNRAREQADALRAATVRERSQRADIPSKRPAFHLVSQPECARPDPNTLGCRRFTQTREQSGIGGSIFCTAR